MILNDKQIEETIKPLMSEFGRDPEGVTKAMIKFIHQDREAFKKNAPGDTSDGYHTFNELYLQRMLYNAALFNAWGLEGENDVHKSWYHSDGELAFSGGWFVVVAELPTGQITQHYEEQYWSLFEIDERELPNEYDGHTPEEAVSRLGNFVSGEGEEGMVEGRVKI